MSNSMPKFDLAQLYVDLLTKGFYYFDGSDLLDEFPIGDYAKIPGVFGPTSAPCDENRHIRRFTELSGPFEDMGRRISEHYLAGLEHRLTFDQFQHFVHREAHAWHKDPVELHDGSLRTCTLNCYYESYDKTTGGELQFFEVMPNGRIVEDDNPTASGNVDPIDDNDPRICGVFPQKYMIIIINQTSRFLHRVTPLNKGRDLMLFNLHLPGMESC